MRDSSSRELVRGSLLRNGNAQWLVCVCHGAVYLKDNSEEIEIRVGSVIDLMDGACEGKLETQKYLHKCYSAVVFFVEKQTASIESQRSNACRDLLRECKRSKRIYQHCGLQSLPMSA